MNSNSIFHLSLSFLTRSEAIARNGLNCMRYISVLSSSSSIDHSFSVKLCIQQCTHNLWTYGYMDPFSRIWLYISSSHLYIFLPIPCHTSYAWSVSYMDLLSCEFNTVSHKCTIHCTTSGMMNSIFHSSHRLLLASNALMYSLEFLSSHSSSFYSCIFEEYAHFDSGFMS